VCLPERQSFRGDQVVKSIRRALNVGPDGRHQGWRKSTLVRVAAVAVAVAGVTGWLTSTSAQSGGGGGTPSPVASVKIGVADLVAPTTARAYYDALPTASTFTNSVAISGQPVLNAPHAEITALARALRNDPDLIYAYVRNTVDTSFTYGVGKGGLGAMVDKSGSAFDQAQLMVLLLRAAGYSATYKPGTITLSAQQFTAWTGITRADAACRLLANGGIPGSINGSTIANCAYGSDNVTSVSMAHIWVAATIGGSEYLFDPAYKPYTVKTGVNLSTVGGLTSGQPLQDASSGVQTGTASGVGYVRSLNATALNARIQSTANALQTHIDANLQSGDVDDLIGGREIQEIPTTTTLRQTSLPYGAVATHSWSNIPDAYRASVRVNLTKVKPEGGGAMRTLSDRVLYFDDIYGRKLNFYTRYRPKGSEENAFDGRLTLVDGQGQTTILDSYAAVENARLSYGQLILTVNAPYAAAAGAYMDVATTKEVTYALPFTIVAGWGETTRNLVSHWGSRSDAIAPLQSNPQACETCGTGLMATYGDARREQLAVEWMAQASRAGALHAQIAGSVFQPHYAVGMVSADTFVRFTAYGGQTGPVGSWYSIGDSYDRLDIDTGFSLTSRTSDAAARRAAVHALATTINALEGSVAAQVADLPDVTSVPSRFAWGNAPPSGEDQAAAGTGARRFYTFNNGNAANAVSLTKAEGRGQETWQEGDNWHGPVGEPVIGSQEVNIRRGRLAEAISAYAAAGFSVVSAEDAFLGPGQRGGAFVKEGTATGIYSHRASFQRGGALVATRYDANGDPLEIAHVTVGYYDNAKGGGGGAQLTHGAQYDPSKMADFLKDEFVDRSDAAGVDLGAGSMSYTSPASLTVGQGEFPYSLSAGLTWRGGSVPDGNAHYANSEPNGAWTTNWNNTLSVSASGLEAMGETDVRAVAGTVAAFLVLQDIYKATPSTERDVAGALAAAWWMKHLAGNVVTATVGTNSQQFLRRADGQWFSPGGRYATLIQTGQRTIVTEHPSCADLGGVQYIGTRGWSYQGVSFQVKSAAGDVQNFQSWQYDVSEGTQESCARTRGFRMASWTFPQGVNINLTYAMTSGSPLPDLTEVSNNLGYKIAFDKSGILGFSNGLTGADRRAVTVARDAITFDPSSHTDATGAVFNFATHREGPNYYRRFVFDRAYLARDPSKASIEYTYDVFGRVTEAKDAEAVANPSARGSHKFFIAEGFRGQREDPLGGRYTVETLRRGRESRHIDEMQRVSTAVVDGRGRVVSRTAAYGNITEFEYDERNNVVTTRRKSRVGCGTDIYWCQTSTVTATYNSWNKPATITLPATLDGQTAGTWIFAYDSQGRLTTQTSPDVFDGRNQTWAPSITRTAYDSFGRVRWTQDPTGIESRMEYGANNTGRCMTAQHAADQSSSARQTTTFVCDAAGDVISITDARLNTSTVTFDLNRRKTGEYGPTSTAIKTTWTYDADGNALTESRWNSATSGWLTTTTAYSLTNKPLSVTDPAGDVARTCYDALDRATITADPSGNATRTSFNAAGQPWRIERWFKSTGAGGCTLTNTRPSHLTTNTWREIWYNGGGLPAAEFDGNFNQTTLTYDGLGRLIVTTYADGKTASTVRNERDQVYFLERRDGDMQQIWYDALGRSDRTWELFSTDPVWPHGRQTKTSFDLAGRPMWTAVSTQTGSTYDPALERDVRTYQYDAAGRVELDRIQPNNGTMGANQLVLTYGYDKTNNRTSIQWPDGYRADYRFDAANRADRVTFGPAASPTQNYADIAVDSLSRRTGVARSNGANSSYAYEADDDLSSLNHSWASGVATLPATFGYQHDAEGRITLTTVNQVSLEWMPTLAEAASYGTPTNLNQTTSVNGTGLNWDDNGNLRQYGSTQYRWTYGNRLWQVIKPTSTTEYGYDSIDRRTSVIEDGVMTRTLWSGQDEVGQYNAAGAVLRRFIPDGSGSMDARLAAVDTAGTIIWFHTDHQGSVIATTNGAGQPIQFANYSPHGKFGTDQNGVTYSAPPSGSPFGYTGRQWDAKAGLYNYRARYYDPALGVFLSMDPIGTKDDPNLYMYVGLDPVNATDPDGLQQRRLPPPPPTPSQPRYSPAGQLAAQQIAAYNIRGARMDARYRPYTWVGGEPGARDVASARAQFGQAQANWANANGMSLASNQPGAQYQNPTNAPRIQIGPRVDFVVSPNGTSYPVPTGATGPVPVINSAQRQTGVAFTGGSGGQNGRVFQMRIMFPTPARGNAPAYPNGNISYQNGPGPNGQNVNPYSGRTVSNQDGHYPIQ